MTEPKITRLTPSQIATLLDTCYACYFIHWSDSTVSARYIPVKGARQCEILMADITWLRLESNFPHEINRWIGIKQTG